MGRPQMQQQIWPSMTGGSGFVNNSVQPTSYRMEDFDSNVPVKPAIKTPGAEAGAQPSSSVAAMESSSAASKEESAAETFPKELIAMAAAQGYELWSPGMENTSASGYEEGHEGQYSYSGEQPFHMQ